MSVFRDMARDGGYRGDEAEQVASMLEEQERERWESGQEPCGRPPCDSCGDPSRVFSPDHNAHFCERCAVREGLAGFGDVHDQENRSEEGC